MTSTTRSDDHERSDLSPHRSHGRDGRRSCEGAAQARAPSARARPQGRRASGGASYVGRRDNRRRSPRSRLASPRDGGRGGCILRLPIQRRPHRRGGVHRAGGDRGRRSVARQHVAEIGAPRSQKSRRARPLVSERVFDWSGVPTTHIRPTFFAEWLLYPLPGWQVKSGVIRFPLGRGRHAPIASEDQGRLIAAVLTNPAPHAGKVYPLFGPVELNHYEIAEKLSATLGRPFRYEPLSIPQFVTEMQSSGLTPRFIQHIASVAQDYQDGIFAGTNDVIETLTGKPPLTLEEFVAHNRAKFAI